MTDLFDLSHPDRKIHVGVILLNSTTEILDVAPFHIMGSVSSRIRDDPDDFYGPELKKQAIDIECHWVSETGEPAQLTTNMRVVPTDTFATCPILDVVLMGASSMKYIPSAAELAFIRQSFESCHAFIAVCGGFQAPLLAGVLEGKTATAPVPLLPRLQREHPETEWVTKRWHRDGKLWTTGTLLNGLDAMRAFVEHTWGGQGGLVEQVLEKGAWPARDVDYEGSPR